MTRVQGSRDKYVAGVAVLDRVADEQHSAAFVDLTEAQQDDVLQAIERPGADATEAPQPWTINYGGPAEPALQQTSSEQNLDFFELLVTHTRQGFYADPIYGGNRDRVGWDVIGFPGPSSLAEVHQGRYSTIDYFADNREHPGGEPAR